MADRHTLHFSQLLEFKNWLIKNGWEIKPLSKSGYEVLRAVKEKQWIIVYKKEDAKEHFSLTDNGRRYVGLWLNELKIRKQVCDEIRKEIAENFDYDDLLFFLDKVEKGNI